jgi:antitoxin HigA-1
VNNYEEEKKKTNSPGIILDEHYIKPLNLNLQELANPLGLARNTLFKIRTGVDSITPSVALALAEAFDTTPQLWLNLQQKYDLWIEENEKTHEHITPIFKGGILFPLHPSTGIRNCFRV